MIFNCIAFLTPLFAQDVPVTPPASPPPGGGFGVILFVLPFFFIFYWFFMLRPQQKQEEQQRKMLNSLEKNDRVLTVGGIIAAVYAVDKEKNEIVLKVDDSNGTKIKFQLSAVLTVFPKDKDNDKTAKIDSK
ncbi:MAG: preprotein translocase subunit YajC [Planctomycetaceae bacterium]|jgi:preprotein translocase subunit YajC|nr:preprotein translocase subunit YajC [Planctomycetaceae bacterium]